MMLPTETKKPVRKIYALSDEFIGQLRDLIQLSIISGTNIVDNLRQVRLEQSASDLNMLTMTPEYVEYYNRCVEKLVEEVEKMKKEDLERAAKEIESK